MEIFEATGEGGFLQKSLFVSVRHGATTSLHRFKLKFGLRICG